MAARIGDGDKSVDEGFDVEVTIECANGVSNRGHDVDKYVYFWGEIDSHS